VIPHGTVKLATGLEVELVNINVDGGILIRSEVLIKPGSYVRLKLDVPGASANLGGYVRRCKIASIKHAKIHYEAAILLDEKFPFPLGAKLQKPGASISLEEIKPGNNGTSHSRTFPVS